MVSLVDVAVAVAACWLSWLWWCWWKAAQHCYAPLRSSWDYGRVQRLVRQSGKPVPIGVVNIDAFDRNTDKFIAKLKASGSATRKQLRIATKSIRVPELVRRVAKRHQDIVAGVMCFSVRELRLYMEGSGAIGDILLAYPIVQEEELDECWRVSAANRQLELTLMVDCPEHVRLIGECWLRRAYAALMEQAGRPVVARLCIDYDMAYHPLPGVYLGAHRSPCRTAACLDAVLNSVTAVNRCWSAIWETGTSPSGELLAAHNDVVSSLPWLEKHQLLQGPLIKVTSVMGYEAQIAGVPDNSIWDPLRNLVVRVVKHLSEGDVKRRRLNLRNHLKQRDVKLEMVNGGGTGSFQSTCSDPSVTEVTLGSGLLQSRLFDFYQTCDVEPALVYVLAVTRKARTCGADIVTCQSGGFVASGEVNRDKAPCVFLPPGYGEIPTEGFGEVQTPLRKLSPSARDLSIGDLVFLRPAKSGEIAERFDKYLIIRDQGDDVEEMETYRGHGVTAY